MDIEKTTSKVFGSTTATMVVSFATIAYFSTILGAGGIGVYFLFEAVIGIAGIPSNLGIDKALSKRLSEGENQGEFLSAAVLVKVVPLVVVGSVLYAFQVQVQNYVGAPAITYILIFLFINQYYKTSQKILQGERKVATSAYLRFGEKILFLIIGTSMLTLEKSPEGLMIAKIMSEAILIVGTGVVMDTKFQWPNLGVTSSLLDYSRYSLISHIGGYTYNWMDILLIGYFLSPEFVGAYEIAWRITKITSLSGAVGTTIFPEISRLHAREEFEKITSILYDSIFASLYLVIPALIGGALLSSEILGTIYGEEFTIASVALIILLIEKVFHSIHKVLGESLQAVNRPDLAAVSSVIAIAINLGLNFILIPIFGISGAATATCLSFTVNTLLHMYFLSDEIKIQLPFRKLLVSAGASVIMGLLVYAYVSYFGDLTLIELMVCVSLGGVVYVGLTMQNDRVRKQMQRYII
jgi:O-antigen/teichoic acid export membrane protein